MSKKEVSITPPSRLGEERNEPLAYTNPGEFHDHEIPVVAADPQKNHQETTF
jgi:hypothetical protein